MKTLCQPSFDAISFLRDTKSVGELSELIVAVALGRAGYGVVKPLGENSRYDLIIDKDGKLSRVQVKTGRLRNGAILFHAYSTHSHRNRIACRPYTDEIDFFGIYCPDLGNVYLVPIEDTARGTLRVEGTKKWAVVSGTVGSAVPGRRCARSRARSRGVSHWRSNGFRPRSAVVAQW